MSRIKDLRMQLTEDDIRNILLKYGAEVQGETEQALIFPTVCHNATGGSPKLYYYKEDKIFRCYTECNAMFDIFDLLMRIKKVRGEKIGLPEAIKLTGVEENHDMDEDVMADLQYLKQLSKESASITTSPIKHLDRNILRNFPYDPIGNKSWLDEGITKEAMERFQIGYNKYLNAITIPNFDYEHNLIGVRGRFLNPESKAKYMPIKYKGDILSHPTGKYLYGYNENKETINQKGIIVLFEGEKSVLKMESLFPNNNVSLSTSGKKITLDHLNALLKLNAQEVVLAYDKDYQNQKERKETLEEYEKIVSILNPYFDVSIIVDDINKLGYKDSPIDQGKEVFQDLMRHRIKR